MISRYLFAQMILTDERSKSFSDELCQAIEEALDRRGISARQASLAVVGHDGLIRDIRAGRVPSADRVEALMQFLGLEFYIGPRRDLTPTQSPVGTDFVRVPMYDAELSAGAGFANSEDAIASSIAFKADWLRQMGLNPQQCCIVKVSGVSMEPTLCDGDIVLIDQQTREIRDMKVYAFVDVDGDARVKRFQRRGNQLLLISDEKSHAPELRSSTEANLIRIIGQVVWSGHEVPR